MNEEQKSKSKPSPYDNSLDWKCEDCGYSNFGRNQSCRKCKQNKKNSDQDWKCECGFSNFQFRMTCRECTTARPKVPGDWQCENCNFMVFRSKSRCMKCRALRPDMALKREAEKKEEDLDGKCLTCLTAKADMVIIKCKHMCLCKECIKKVNGKCPICREEFEWENTSEVIKAFW